MGVWYKQWYETTKAGEAALRAALADADTGVESRADITRRLTEMNQLIDDRCHISLQQRRFLERVLNG